MSAAPDDITIRIRPRLVAWAAAGALTVVVAFAVASGGLVRAAQTETIASDDAMRAQQAAAEVAVQRAYDRSLQQVQKVRSLKLAVAAVEADAIATKAIADLGTLRHGALASIGLALGLPTAEADRYATAVEQRFASEGLDARPSASPMLLAPRLYQIASRMSELATGVSDRATADLTAPARTPAPSPTPTRAP